MTFIKSQGQSETEKFLAGLCDRTFLKLWSYPNLYKADGKELCDILVIFQNHVFLFFDRESKKFENPEKDIQLQWERWKKEVIDKQIATAEGAKRYIHLNKDKIYLDQNARIPLPIPITENMIIHKIIVAHGAKEACKNFSESNISGSLAIGYSSDGVSQCPAFFVDLKKVDPVHIFDSHNLEIILTELDTVYDFTAYITEKEAAIKKFDFIFYCGEEDLLGHYFRNYDERNNKYSIGVNDSNSNGIFIPEGEWESFIRLKQYKLRKQLNEQFRFWDELIQTTCQNAFDGTVKGNGNIFTGQSALYEMAMEPRFMRRSLSHAMITSIKNFPEDIPGLARNVSFMPSFYKEKGYVFLQVKHPNIRDYENDYRPKRQAMLEIACAAAKNKFPHLSKIIGIGIDAPKFSLRNAEDFILLNCEEWSEEDKQYYEQKNQGFKFFQTDKMTQQIRPSKDFPDSETKIRTRQIARNEKCPCGPEKKYKRCCGKD
jgi:hypothetical protein